MVFLSIVVFILVLSIIIIIHEFGHLIMAKRAGILCYEFSIGFGPKIWSKKKGETTYSIRAIPLGGYVQMAGEEGTGVVLENDVELGYDLEGEVVTRVYFNGSGEFKGILRNHEIYKEMYLEIEKDDTKEIVRYDVKKDAMFTDKNGNEVQVSPYDRCFDSKSIGQRFLALFAGPFMNFVLGFVVLIIYSFIVGVPNTNSSVVGKAYYNAENAEIISKDGVKLDIDPSDPNYKENKFVSLEGFEITKVNDTDVNGWSDVSAINNSLSDNLFESTIIAKKDGVEYELSVRPYLFFGSLGLYSNLNDTSTKGVKVNLYCVNAENAGIKDNSVVIKIDDVDINNVQDLIDFSNNNVGKSIVMTLLDSDGKEYNAEYKMYDQKTVEKLDIGVWDLSYGLTPTYKFSFFKCIGNSFKYFGNDSMSVFNTLNLLFTSKDVGVKNLSGPVGIYQLISSSLTQGFVSLLSLIALLTINIGIVNLLPIPALDGGRIVFLMYELITRRKPNKKFENALNTIMFILIMILFVYITFNDILRF